MAAIMQSLAEKSPVKPAQERVDAHTAHHRMPRLMLVPHKLTPRSTCWPSCTILTSREEKGQRGEEEDEEEERKGGAGSGSDGEAGWCSEP